MEYYIFHHTPPLDKVHDRAVQIWLPLSSDVASVIDYLNAFAPQPVRVMLESGFKSFLPPGYPVGFFNPVQKETKPIRRVLLFAQSDTLAHSCRLMGEALSESVEVVYIIPPLKKENADMYFLNHNKPFQIFSNRLLRTYKPDLLILLNDWSKQPQWIISLCRLKRIPVVCMQESVIDFGDTNRRMLHADEVMLQATQSVLDLNRKTVYLTGNPRYESLLNLPSSSKKYVLVNCNFTYGIFEDIRMKWMGEVIGAINKKGFDYLISQHPRDKADLSSYRQVISSSSSSVAEQLRGARCLITRFSSLIHEALVAGVPVIYYNPHDEQMKYQFRFNQSFLFIATNTEELSKALDTISIFDADESMQHYLINHCIQPSSPPSKNLLELIRLSLFKSQPFMFSDFWKCILYHPFVLRFVWYFKKS